MLTKHRYKRESIYIRYKEEVFSMRLVKDWLPREVMNAISLEIPKVRMDWALSNLT